MDNEFSSLFKMAVLSLPTYRDIYHVKIKYYSCWGVRGGGMAVLCLPTCGDIYYVKIKYYSSWGVRGGWEWPLGKKMKKGENLIKKRGKRAYNCIFLASPNLPQLVYTPWTLSGCSPAYLAARFFLVLFPPKSAGSRVSGADMANRSSAWIIYLSIYLLRGVDNHCLPCCVME